MGSMGKRRGRRTKSDRGGRRTDITRGFQIPMAGPRRHDPPWRSIPEGRGLPHTPLIKALLPLAFWTSIAFIAVVLALGLLLG